MKKWARKKGRNLRNRFMESVPQRVYFKLQFPNHISQTNSKHQFQMTKCFVWNFEFRNYLSFGACDLVLAQNVNRIAEVQRTSHSRSITTLQETPGRLPHRSLPLSTDHQQKPTHPSGEESSIFLPRG